MSEDSKTHHADAIVVPEGPEAVRRRPGMYIGSVGERGLHHMVFEVAGWALEEVLCGTAGHVGITLTGDGGVRVAADGTGLAVEQPVRGDGPSLEAQLATSYGGVPTVGRRSLFGGPFRVGLAVVNALSSRLTARARRDGALWVSEYERGVAVAPPAPAGPADGSGTVISFWPDAEIFETVQIPFDVVAERLRELAFLNRDVDIELIDARSDARTRAVHFRFPGGLRDRMAEQGSPLHRDVVSFESEPAGMEGTVEVALRWCDFPDERVASYANSLPTTCGGTHELGFRDGLAAAINAYAREQGLLSPADPDLTASRLGVGLTAVVSVKLDRPEFEGATRRRLGNVPVRAGVAEAVREGLLAWLRAEPAQAAIVVAAVGGAPSGE